MSNVIPFRTPKNSRELLFPIDLAAAVVVADIVSLRPGPAETPSMFVIRLVRAYEAAKAGAL